jgi:hypothetical protein
LQLTGENDIVSYECGGDVYIPELKDSIDGIIICQNALDHTPNWMFILSNIASYARGGGCHLYLWTDIDHLFDPTGHFNIAQNPTAMFRLVENIGFGLIYSRIFTSQNGNLGICLVGVKK